MRTLHLGSMPTLIKDKYLWSLLITILCILEILDQAVDRVSGRNLADLSFFKSFLTPDGLLYTARTLLWLGLDSGQVMSDLGNLYFGTQVEVTSRAINPPEWESALVNSRLLYPILSIPFVYVFGSIGMIAVPILCYLAIPIFTLLCANTPSELKTAKIFALAYCASFYTSYNLLKNTTEALSSFFFVLFVFCLLQFGIKGKLYPGSINALAVSVFGVSVCATRQLDVVILATYALYCVLGPVKGNFFRRAGLFFTLFLPHSIWLGWSFRAYQNYEVVTRSDETQIDFSLNSVASLSRTFLQVIVIESGQFAAKDGLFFIAFLYVMFMIWRNSKTLAISVSICVLLCLALTAINGSLGSGLRYVQPVLSAIGLVSIFASRLSEERTSYNRKNKLSHLRNIG